MYWLCLVITAAIISPLQSSVNECEYYEVDCDGGCLAKSRQCDGIPDCNDGSDEETCPHTQVCDWSQSLQCDGTACKLNENLCYLPEYPIYAECTDKMDLVDCPCTDGNTRCESSKACVAKDDRCNSVADNGCGGDAPGCDYNSTDVCPAGNFECLTDTNETKCYPFSMMCDSTPDSSDKDCVDDEKVGCAVPGITFGKPRPLYAGETFTLVATITGKPQPKVTLLKYNKPLSSSERIIIDYIMSTDPSIVSRDYRVTFKNIGIDLIGYYKIFAENKGYNEITYSAGGGKSLYATKLSPTIVIGLGGKPDIENLNITNPEEKGKPQDVSLIQGETYVMYCNVYGSPSPVVTFLKDGVNLTNVDSYEITSKISTTGQNQTIWMLTIKELVRADNIGSYTCYGVNPVGEDSIIVNMDINIKPYITSITEGMNVKTGSNITLECIVEGYPTPTISWVDSADALISSGSVLNITTIPINGSPHVYLCRGENDYGTSESSITINVYNAPVVIVEDFVVEHEIFWSNNFNVTAVNLNRIYTITQNGAPLDYDIWYHSSIDESFDGMVIYLEAVNDTSYDNIGTYTITVTNDIGSTSQTFLFEVEIEPEFTVELNENTTIDEGSIIKLSVEVLAYPHPTYEWLINGTVNPNYTSATLTKTAYLTDNGTYEVIATNIHGNVSSTTVVMVIPYGCANEPCQNNGTCTDLGNSQYNCTCHENFGGTDCEENLWCDKNPCQNGGQCSEFNYPENYGCSCAFGFKGEHCEIVIDYCTEEGGDEICGVAQDKGICTSTGIAPDGFQCYCKYTNGGMYCNVTQLCTPNPCQNEGLCIASGTDTSCQCPDAYMGDFCETKKEWWCDGKCNGRARCYDKTDKRCLCEYPWIGDSCQTALVDPLHFHLSITAYLLSNLNIFRKDEITQSVELPLMLGDQAGKLILLTQHPGSITNLTGDQVWVTIDQNRTISAKIICSDQTTTIALPNPVPADTPLRFRFRVQFTRAKLSVSSYHTSDETYKQTLGTDLPAGCAEFREQRIGNYRADNIDMYIWDDVIIGDTIVRSGEDDMWTRGREVEDTDPCVVNLCNNGGTCTVVDNKEVCECIAGYTGVKCTEHVDTCTNIQCLNSGQCTNGACVCNVGYTGILCEKELVHSEYVLGPQSSLIFKLHDSTTFDMTFEASSDLDAVQLLTIGSGLNQIKFGIQDGNSYITVLRGSKKGVYTGPIVSPDEATTLNMTIDDESISLTLDNVTVILESLPPSTDKMFPLEDAIYSNINAGTLTLYSLSGTLLSGTNIGTADNSPCHSQCGNGTCVQIGTNTIQCTDCPSDTNPLTCDIIGCIPGCDGACTDLGYCSCNFYHQGDRCTKALDFTSGSLFPSTISKDYSFVKYSGSGVMGYSITIKFSIKLQNDDLGLIAKAVGNGGQMITWHLSEEPSENTKVIKVTAGASFVKYVALPNDIIGRWTIFGFEQDCSKASPNCDIILTVGTSISTISSVGCLWDLTGDLFFGAVDEKGVIASFAYPVIGLTGQEQSLSQPSGGQNLVKSLDHICDIVPSPCKNSGTCTKEGDYYKCTCTDGWIGDHCEREKTVCDDVTCSVDSTCIVNKCLCNYPYLQSESCNIMSTSVVGLCSVKEGYIVVKGIDPKMTTNLLTLRFNVKIVEKSDGNAGLVKLVDSINGAVIYLSTIKDTSTDTLNIAINGQTSTSAVYGWNTVELKIQYKEVSLWVNNAAKVTSTLNEVFEYDGTVHFGQFTDTQGQVIYGEVGCLNNIVMNSLTISSIIEGYGVSSCVNDVVEDASNELYGSAELWDIVEVM